MIHFPGKKYRLVPIVAAAMVLLACGVLFLAFTPYALRSIWLPAAARSAGVSARAEKIYLKTLIPFRIEAVNFHYADSEIVLDIPRISTRLRLDRLKKHEIELCDTRISGIRIRRLGVLHQPSAASVSSASGRTPESETSQPWFFSMQNFEVKDAVFEFENQERKAVHIWTVKSLYGNRFRIGEVCSLTADASLRVYPDRHNPMEIRALPFRLRGDYQLDSDFRLKTFSMALKTGVCDLSITDEIVIPPQAGIRALVRAEGSFPNPETFRVIRSETHLFKGSEEIGNLQFRGEIGMRFQLEGVFSDLDMRPYLSILAPDSRVSLKLPRAEFAVTGSDFSQEGIRKDLKVRLIARMTDLSVPVELNRKSRLLRLVMIPLEAMPSFFEIINMKWNLRHELDQCINSFETVISGQQNLNFDQAQLDLTLENGILQIRDFILRGRDIEMESIRGTLNLVTEKMNMQTVLIINSVKLPLKFKGTLSHPAPHFKEALKDFLLLNTPLLKNLESLLTEPPSTRDSKLEKAIKRGYRDLHQFLQ